jgi:rubrerythrin
MDADHVIATLNRLRRAETASLLPRLAESTVFVQPSETAAYAEIQRMVDEERQHLRWLDEVILALDGTVVPGRADIRSADLHYVTLSTTLCRVAQDQRLLTSTYEAAAPDVAESSRAASVVTRIAERHRQHAERLDSLLGSAAPSPA